MNAGLARINELCYMWNMRLNPLKTKTMVVSRSRTHVPIHGELRLGDTVFVVLTSIVILGVTFDSKMVFDAHIRNVASSVSKTIN